MADPNREQKITEIYSDWVMKIIAAAKELAHSENPQAVEISRSGADHMIDAEFQRLFAKTSVIENQGIYDFTFTPWLPEDIKKQLSEKLGIKDTKSEWVYPENKGKEYRNQNTFSFSKTKWKNIIYAKLNWYGEGTGGSKEFLLANSGIENPDDLRMIVKGEKT